MKKEGPRVNEQIRSPEIRLLGHEGTQYGVVSLSRARDIANETGLDLVEVSPTAKPPVVKLIDFGKYKYEAQKKLAEAKKKTAVIHLKEVQFRPNIEKHDLEVKLKSITRFLEHGDKVRMIMQFKGREIAYKQAGLDKFNAIVSEVVNVGGIVEADPKFMGSRVIAIIAPKKTK